MEKLSINLIIFGILYTGYTGHIQDLKHYKKIIFC